MPGLLFVSQATLESWVEQGRIEFTGNVMTLHGGEGAGCSYALEPAVRFVRVVGGESDSNGLLQQVRSVAQLKALGADAAGDSCILGDVAYEVEPGFVAAATEPHAAQAAGAPGPLAPETGTAGQTGVRPAADAQAARSRPLGAAPLPKDLEDRRKEAEALARLFLEKLS